MYFNNIPDIKYDQKPIRYPFSESDFVTAKNFFRRFKVNDDLFSNLVFYNRYTIKEKERLDTLSEKFYGVPDYDWVIALTNNIINPLFDMPVSEYTLRKIGEDAYGEEEFYSGIHHYETFEVLAGYKIDGKNVIALEGGIVVDENFYNSQFKYWDGNQYVIEDGKDVCKQVTNFEYEQNKNELNREIFILKNKFIQPFVSEFISKNFYKQSSGYISKKLKQSGI